MARRTFIRLQIRRKSSCDRTNRFWCYFLVHTFKIKKFESISSNGSRDIAKPSCVRVKIGSFDSQYTPFKQKNPHSIISTRSWVLVYITFAHGWTDGRTDIFRKSFLFSSWSRIYIQISPPFWPKLVYLFSYGNGYENCCVSLISILEQNAPLLC